MASGPSDPHDETTRSLRQPQAFGGGRYTVIRPLGEGGQKVVYLVHDNALDRDCALSVVRSALLDPEDVLRLNREAQAMARLGAHSHIVTVFDYGNEDGTPYLVCEYVRGGDLRHELTAAGGRLSLDRALMVGAELADALAAAHARGVIHRDVKPANIWLDDAGHAKLGDFGLAFSLDRSRLTMPGTLMGTAAYVSPEQIKGEPATERSDLYALGCVLYEMLCGRPPFVDDNPAAAIAQHLNATPARPSAHNSSVPAAVDGLILRLLEKLPERRPATALAVAEELRACRGGGTGPLSRSSRRRGRPLLAVGGALTIAVVVAIGAIAFVALGSSGGAGDAGRGSPLVADGYTPALEPRECPPEAAAEGTDLQCYDLIVPETRSDPTGRQVRIPVLIAPSRVRDPGAPLVVLGTGFNGPSLTSGDVRGYADSITMGARGGDFATPKLTCPELAAVEHQRVTLPSAGPEVKRLFLDTAEQCGKRLQAEGVDLDAYGLREVADDVTDLVIAKGWAEINIEAHWQYSRVPNLISARHARLVRSVVLVDAAPPDAAVAQDVAAWNEALQAYAAACSGDTVCARTFPDIEAAVQAVYDRLERERPVVEVPDPQSGEQFRVLVDGASSVSALLSALQVNPEAIASALRADDTALNSIIAGSMVHLEAGLGAEGARLSQFCEDEAPALSRGGAQVVAAAYPLLGVFAANDPDLEVCDRWPTKQRSGVIGAFRPTNPAPALIIAGALNPFSPPSYARQAASGLTEATVAVFPSLSSFAVLRGPPCLAALRLQFLRDPHAKLDVNSCVASTPPLRFEGS